MHSYLRVIIFVVSICMKIDSTRAICAAGQYSTVSTDDPCTEPELIPSGSYLWGYRCDNYANSWAGFCKTNGNCNACPCSCKQGGDCPPRTNEVCTTCPLGYRGDGLTCTSCRTGTLSTAPVSDTCTSSCFSGYYLSDTGCADCPAYSSSSYGSSGITACECNAGYMGANDGTCTQCVAGKYSSE